MDTAKQAYAWGHGQVNRALKIDFIRFCIVGAMGFAVNTFFLYITHGILKINIVLAQLISGEAGLIQNFMWHNSWTYKHHDHQDISFWKKFGKFHASSWSGILIMTAIVSIGTAVFKLNYLIALVFAAAITMVWNFFWTRFFIFKGHTPRPLLHPESTVDTK